MLIECPACHTSATLPDSKEGAKVRCGECGRVYVARIPGRGKSSQSSPLPIVLTVVGVVVLAGLMMMMRDSGPDETQAVAPVVEKEKEPVKDYTGWNSELVQLVNKLHEAAFARDEVTLERLIHPPSAWDWKQSPPTDEGADEAEEAVEREPAIAWSSLDGAQQADFASSLIEELTTGAAKDLVADWKAFDGLVLLEEEETGIVRVNVSARDPQVTESRNIEWHLVRDGARWKARSWERWYSPEELKAMRIRRKKITQRVTLSDGSVVIEAEPKPLEHLEDTPPELRKTIDDAYAQLVDLDLSPRDNAAAKQLLVNTGKPALPILLTGLYEIPLETEEQAIQINLINQCLEEITGNYTGYKPQVGVGSATGTSEERRQSAIKQWFGWWYRKGEKFESAQFDDLLETELAPTSEREQRELEKYKRDQARDQARKEADG